MHFRLSRAEFQHLALLITEVFTTETAGTYYNASSNGKNPTGKLMSAFSNLRHSLGDAGLINRDTRNTTSNVIQAIEVQPEELDALIIIQAEEWNKEQLLDAWKLTHDSRQKDLKTNISTSQYMEQYPFLRQPNGYELVSISFYRQFLLMLSIVCSLLWIQRLNIRQSSTSTLKRAWHR